MIGRRYKYQGDGPSGFDCSGLVRYSYLAAGLDVPHNTKALKNATRSIGKSLRKGDLVFFNEKGGKYSHVGIYIGGDKFVHAPSSGQRVRKDSLLGPYWKKRFIDARRFI
jgi:cell wall-associated NlpC family hydrolase